MHILIVTDAWHPQINGVVRTISTLVETLRARGARVDMITPERFRTVPLPTYREIRLAVTTPAALRRRIEEIDPDIVHIATEGPLGTMARRVCLRSGMLFTTSYHTRFPEYLRARLPIPYQLSYGWLRSFHNAGRATLVATPSLADELRGRGFRNIRLWTRGVDTEGFHPSRRATLDLPRPIFLSVGRVAVEKNLPAFLDLPLPGSKVVIGDGPDLSALRERYEHVHFLGCRTGDELAGLYASADVFVFPSRSDTFGMVILEALASGLPVAAYPVTGPRDIIEDGVSGALDTDLRAACLRALALPRQAARQHAEKYGWDACTDLFLDHLQSALVGNRPYPLAA